VETTTTPPLRGDEAELYAQNAERLRRHVSAAVRTSPAVIDDACQFAWTALLRHQPRRETWFAWLRMVAIREAWHLSRLEGRTAPLEAAEFELAGGVDPEQHLAARESLRLVASLPPRQRRMIALQAAGHSREEIAGVTGDTVRTVDRQLVRAKHRLRAAA
jgi:DNA-directed RNA polymerase specialized sigma24 family protein